MSAQSPPSPSPSPARLTGRAALLAVVICAIALSLAYPVREYIAQRQRIDQLTAQEQSMSAQVKSLQAERARLAQAWYIEQRARDELHMCFPREKCYTVLSGQSPFTSAPQRGTVVTPWYTKLWQSVQRAGVATRGPAR